MKDKWDRTDEVGTEGICSECGKEKIIKAAQEGKIFCDDCFSEEYSKGKKNK
jgi:formylmethanofuran dehydrogenase subunit E